MTDLSRTCLIAARAVALAALLTAVARAADQQVKEGQWTRHDTPKGWVVVETAHYQIQCEIGEATAKKLGEHLEAMLKLYAAFMPTHRSLETFILKVFKDKQGFCAYSGNKPDTPVVAYYSQDTKELVGYDCGFVFGKRTTPALLRLRPDTGDTALTDKERQRVGELLEAATDAYTFDLVRVLSHEGWHQYFHFYTVSWVPMPAWLDEGVGDYFFMAPKDMSAGELSGYDIGRINVHRLRRIRRGLADGQLTPFEQFMDFDQAAYYQNGSLNYAQGWAMVHFLLQNADPVRRELIPRLIRDFKDSKNFRKSTDRIFKDQSYATLDKDFTAWLRAQTIDDPLLTLARELGDKLKPSALEGESRLLDVYKWYLEHPKYPDPAADAPPGSVPVTPPADPPATPPTRKKP